MLRKIVLITAFAVFSAATAHAACPGQTGQSIFADDFSDSTGGWDLDSSETYVPGAVQIKASGKNLATGSYNQTFNAVDADYCLVGVFPPEAPDPGVDDMLALGVLGTDYNNLYKLYLYSIGVIRVNKVQGGNSTTLFSVTSSSVNTKPGSENTLRIIVKNQRLTFFVNGTQIDALRAQTPKEGNRFSFFGGAVGDKAVITSIDKDRIYTIKSFSVTEAP